MNADGRHVTKLAHDLLRRVTRARRADRFRLGDVCPCDATQFATAFERLVEFGYVERVVERVGVWHYRLTESGRAAARERKPPPVMGGRTEGE